MYQTIDVLNAEQLHGLVVLNFGANWCGICKAAQPMIESVLAQYPQFTHIKIEDAKSKRLGRLHSVKLWPTLIFMKDGTEMQRLVRPTDGYELEEAIQLTAS